MAGKGDSLFLGIALQDKRLRLDGTYLIADPALRSAIELELQSNGTVAVLDPRMLYPKAQTFVHDRYESGSRLPTVYLAPCLVGDEFAGTALDRIREETRLLFLCDRSFSHPSKQKKEVDTSDLLSRGWLRMAALQ